MYAYENDNACVTCDLDGYYLSAGSFTQKGQVASRVRVLVIGVVKSVVMQLKATAEQLQARLGLRRSSAAQKHKNKKRALKRPGKGDRGEWKRDVQS